MATTYAIPDGRVAMAATTYTGNGSTLSVSNAVNGVSMQPDLVWVKGRSVAYSHGLYDSVRGATKRLISNLTNAEDTLSGVTAFNSGGFSLGSDINFNENAATYVGWQWKAGGTAVSNTAGSITSSVSANTTAGFSVVTYTGTGANATVGHGLGVALQMLIVKRRDAGGSPWNVWQTGLSGGTYFVVLNATSAQASGPTRFTATPTSTVFNIGTDGDVNASSGTYVAYCFAPVAGYSAFGSYVGNGSTDGSFIYTGMRPRFLMVKRTDSAVSWIVIDTSRNPNNVSNFSLLPNGANAEITSSTETDILSNGFKIRTTDVSLNASGGTYIYYAVAENPFKFSNAR